MDTLETIRRIYVAQTFDATRFMLALRNYLADTHRRRRDQLLTWSRQDTQVAEAEPADARRLCLRLFKPELDRAFLTAFVPIELASAGQVDPAYELPLVQAELTTAQQALTSEQAHVQRLQLELDESRRVADFLAKQLRQQDAEDVRLRAIIDDLEQENQAYSDKLEVTENLVYALSTDLDCARRQVKDSEKEIAEYTFDNEALFKEVETLRRSRDIALNERIDLIDRLAAVQPQLDRLAEIDKNNSAHYESEERPIEPYNIPIAAPAPVTVLRPRVRQETPVPARSRFDLSDSLLELD
jgi:hypothetical protein